MSTEPTYLVRVAQLLLDDPERRVARETRD